MGGGASTGNKCTGGGMPGGFGAPTTAGGVVGAFAGGEVGVFGTRRSSATPVALGISKRFGAEDGFGPGAFEGCLLGGVGGPLAIRAAILEVAPSKDISKQCQLSQDSKFII